jgi:hypothetical protein
LEAFNAAGVDYLLIGGRAVSFHDQPRYTKDYDLWIPPNRIDVLNSIEGITFEEAWPGRVQSTSWRRSDVWVIGLDDLIRNKRAVGRPTDLADVDKLERRRTRPLR